MTPMRTFFTADHHFGHAGIIGLTSRPFADLASMQATMIANWNAVVQPGDDVWHLGDFAVRMPAPDVARIFQRLNGNKHLIVGNHDDAAITRFGWGSVSQMKEITVEGQRLVLFHYGMRTWPGVHRGALQLYGHSHGRLPGTTLSLDVGVDCWNFCPVSLPEIKARLALSVTDEPEQDGGGFQP